MDPTPNSPPPSIQPSISIPTPPPSSRSILAIDLNQIPSPPETLPTPSSLSPTSLVRSFHDNPTPPVGPAAEIPDHPVSCVPCRGTLSGPDCLVCDGCERGFHFSCAGVPGFVSEDWVCKDCVREGVSTRRWRLGRKDDCIGGSGSGFRLLDMNASPPSDADGDEADVMVVDGREFKEARKLRLHDNTFGGYASGDLMSYPNFIYSGNGFGFRKGPTIVTHTMRLDFQDILHNSRSTVRSSEDIGYGSHLGRNRSSNTSFRVPSLNPGEVMQSLRDFVFERHGVLEEGWHVEFRQSKNGFETYAVYCAPDGKIFETMSDVAGYLGLASNVNSVEANVRSDDGSALRRNGLHIPKKRKLKKLPVGNGFMENKEIFSGGFCNGFSSNFQNDRLCVNKCDRNPLVTEVAEEEKGACDLHQFHEGLPLQYEDFFVLSLGKVDARATYYDACQILPVGYRSCWHDKTTGSLFLCHVLDGGDSGPIFKVKRVSCSALPIPYGSTLLQRRNFVQSDVTHKEEGEKLSMSDEECCIEMILSGPCFPIEGDSLSWLLSSPIEVRSLKSHHSEPEATSQCETSQDCSAHSSPVGEKIGEFSVDGHSPSLVWSILSQKLTDACRQIYMQTGSLKFFCKHARDGLSSCYDIVNEKNTDIFSSLDKFCSLLGSLKVPSIVKSNDELDSTVEALQNWLSSDRFGLDAEFVQELIEQCPDVKRCSRYQSLRKRNDYLKAPLVGNGLLLINGRSIEQCQQDTVLDGLYKEYRTTRESATANHIRPPGKHLGVKLPPHLVGDAVQVWQFLSRFHGILSLEPLNFDELEGEIISPWFESLSLRGSSEGDSSGAQVISASRSSALSEQTSSSSGDIDLPDENKLIEMQTATIREEAHASLGMSTDSNHTGLLLRKAHMSLVDVLVSELQIKVAAMVDPSIDGESRSRRGRRRDVDTSILAIRPKLNLLPINELTWLELARRYILAVLSVGGNLDSAETVTRECGKVFRCLQGDGGVLCGSLVGVAGMEADALLLVEATKRIYGSPSSEHDRLTLEDDDPELVITSERSGCNDGNIPEWAQVLEPVRKLPTNVGTRIRKCVYEALEKDPPDWARKKLEYSISKEVYKGNASGPTKKGVLSVLADVHSEASQQKSCKERKKKTIVSISDIITRQCRILLRRAAAADEEKVFCNLLGRNLMTSSENDDEGFLGSPAMVSRPLDFRTIDLRLAVGFYGGSHEAFLEDVRELWQIIRIAYGEQQELVQLAETLSHKFESLYQDEVVALFGKLTEYSKLEQINPEAKKEIEDVIAATSDIPKAPWDEGVCKVCGIDRDDDSVLLCDTCDAEYHTYCLNPPLARIPEGNWYCPTCVSGVDILAGASKGVEFIGQRYRRKYHGESIRNYLEELARLSAVMEQKEYWEFSVDERMLLLKFLCDEGLNSIVIRQHVEQCFETSADLQQKLRTLYSEWKSLKLREDIMATKAAKLGASISNVAGDVTTEGHAVKVAKHNICAELQLAVVEACDYDPSVSYDTLEVKGTNCLERNVPFDNLVKQPVDMECQVEDVVEVGNEENTSIDNHDLHERASKRQKTFLLQECSASSPLPQEASGKDSESSCQGKTPEHGGQNVFPVCKSEDLHGVTVSSSLLNVVASESTPCSASNELQAISDELKVVQKDLAVLQQSISGTESKLLKVSVRMEYLGSDSSGRLYWAAAQSGKHPWVIVDGTMTFHRKQGVGYVSTVGEGSFFENLASGISDSYSSLGGASVGCPFVYGRNSFRATCSKWVYYETKAEIRELIKSLNDDDAKERELKDSILHWQKLRFHEMHQTDNREQIPLEESMFVERNDVPKFLVTKAFTVLEQRYGPLCQGDTMEVVKKRSKRSRGNNDEKLYRCKCLEPIWISRHHCFSCHNTFYTVEELERHNGGKCGLSSSAPGKEKPSIEPSRSLSIKKPETQQHIVMARDKVQAAKTAVPELSRLNKFEHEGSTCPHRFEEISSKFVTDDSIKELLSGIGLIGSEGTPSFVPSVSPFLTDPTLVVKEDNAVAIDQFQIPDKAVSQVDQITGKSCIDHVTDNCRRSFSQNKHNEDSKSGQPSTGIPGERSKKFIPKDFASVISVDTYCTVPEPSLKPVAGRAVCILRHLKISLLDMEAALPEEAIRPSKVHPHKRRAWHAFVKAADTIYEMVQAMIVLEDMIKTEYIKNEWWYWSSLSAAVKTSTLSSLALRIYALDNAIVYDRSVPELSRSGSLKTSGDLDQQSLSNFELSDKSKQGRRSSRKRKDAGS